jgi:hypothetical protein
MAAVRAPAPADGCKAEVEGAATQGSRASGASSWSPMPDWDTNALGVHGGRLCVRV